MPLIANINVSENAFLNELFIIRFSDAKIQLHALFKVYQNDSFLKSFRGNELSKFLIAFLVL